jgi:hypothetical protein
MIDKKDWFYLIWITGMLLVMIGMSFNSQVVFKNDCKMPVISMMGESYNDSKHFTFTQPEQVNMPWASDVIHIFRAIYSIGDLLMLLGCSVVITMFIYYCKEVKHEKARRKRIIG